MTPESPRTTFHQIRRQRADLVATMALLDEAATPERVHEGLRDAYDGLSKALYAYDALRTIDEGLSDDLSDDLAVACVRDAQVRAERDRRRLGRVYVELLEERAR